MNVPAELRYSEDHEWTRVEGNRVCLGITDYAQDALGDVVFIDLPPVGTDVASLAAAQAAQMAADAAVLTPADD